MTRTPCGQAFSIEPLLSRTDRQDPNDSSPFQPDQLSKIAWRWTLESSRSSPPGNGLTPPFVRGVSRSSQLQHTAKRIARAWEPD